MSCCPLLNLKFNNLKNLAEVGDRGTLIKICNVTDHPVMFPFDQGFEAYALDSGQAITGSLTIAPGCHMIWASNPDDPDAIPENTDELIITSPSRLGDKWVKLVLNGWSFTDDTWEVFNEDQNSWGPAPIGEGQTGVYTVRARVDPHIYGGLLGGDPPTGHLSITEYLDWGDGIEQLSYLSVQGVRSVPPYLPANIKSLAHAFDGAINFADPNVLLWDVSNVTDFSYTFRKALKVPVDFSGWNTGSGEHFDYMFSEIAFGNPDNTGFDMSKAKTADGMHYASRRYNRDISVWEMPLLESADRFLDGARAFNQDLTSWCTPLITSEPAGFAANTPAWTLPKPNWGAPC